MMKIHGKLIAILTLLLLSIFSTACNTDTQQTGTTESTTTNSLVTIVSVDWAIYYQNLAELYRGADLIAYGEIDRIIEVQAQTISHTDRGDIIHYNTDFDFNIIQVLKGDETEEAVIHQLGAAGKMTVMDDPLFEPGEAYILFLRKTESGICVVLGGPQGRFKVNDGKVYSMDNAYTDKIIISPELSYNGVDLNNFIAYITDKLR
jgi:hypothetical protein